MLPRVLIFAVLWIQTTAENYIYVPNNTTRSTISGIAAYRSALTLDWLADEDSRQRELAGAFETEGTPQGRVINTDCIVYPRPASGKVARLMLELLKNLEGDEGILISELTQALIRSKLLVETFMLDAEPDLEALVKTPGVMLGEPYASFPRVLAMVWMAATDPTTTKRHGWCLISKVTKFLRVSRPVHVAEQLRALDPIIARARFIIEEFIQHVTPINVFDKKSFGSANPNGNWNTRRAEREDEVTRTTYFSTEPTRTYISAIVAPAAERRRPAHTPVDLGSTQKLGPSARLLVQPPFPKAPDSLTGLAEDELPLLEDEMAMTPRDVQALAKPKRKSAAEGLRCGGVVTLAFVVMLL